MKPTPSSQLRSRLLARVRQKGTSAELQLGQALRALGLRYRKNVRSLPGSPDFANQSCGWAVFAQGCFWHNHTGCRRATVPKANREFWVEKFARNRARDAEAVKTLRRMGFDVVLVWECQMTEARKRLAKLQNLPPASLRQVSIRANLPKVKTHGA